MPKFSFCVTRTMLFKTIKNRRSALSTEKNVLKQLQRSWTCSIVKVELQECPKSKLKLPKNQLKSIKNDIKTDIFTDRRKTENKTV